MAHILTSAANAEGMPAITAVGTDLLTAIRVYVLLVNCASVQSMCTAQHLTNAVASTDTQTGYWFETLLNSDGFTTVAQIQQHMSDVYEIPVSYENEDE